VHVPMNLPIARHRKLQFSCTMHDSEISESFSANALSSTAFSVRPPSSAETHRMAFGECVW